MSKSFKLYQVKCKVYYIFLEVYIDFREIVLSCVCIISQLQNDQGNLLKDLSTNVVTGDIRVFWHRTFEWLTVYQWFYCILCFAKLFML